MFGLTTTVHCCTCIAFLLDVVVLLLVTLVIPDVLSRPWHLRSLLNRNTVTSDVKKAVDANLEFLDTVIKGHFLASACRILGITKLDSKL